MTELDTIGDWEATPMYWQVVAEHGEPGAEKEND